MIDDEIFYLYKRPHLDTFLDFCFKNFNVILWTSAVKEHVDFISKNLMPESPKLKLSKKECTMTWLSLGEYDDDLDPKGRNIRKSILFWEKRDTESFILNNLINDSFLAKHLHRLKKYGIDLNHTIAIDDDPHKFYRSTGNFFKIKSFQFNKPDNELLRMIELLIILKDKDNIRKINKIKELPKKILFPG